MAEAPPPPLREQVRRTLAPVRPLPSPRRRALWLLPVAALVLGAVLVRWGLRGDAHAVGPLWLWAGSAFQLAVAFALLAAALAESIPGRLGGRSSLAIRAAGGLGCVAALTLATFLASPTHAPALAEARYLRICFTHSLELGLLPLAGMGLLMRRGLVARPVLAGTMAGLGAGLVADGGWRLFCEVSDPAHVFAAHLGAVAALALLGGLAGWAWRSLTVGPDRT